MKTFIKIFLALTWCLPQTLLGVICIFLLGCDFPEKTYKGSALVFMSYDGGMSLGSFIFLCEAYYNDESVIRHEYGHTLQSYILGPLYLPVVGIPSLLGAQWTETWADRLSS